VWVVLTGGGCRSLPLSQCMCVRIIGPIQPPMAATHTLHLLLHRLLTTCCTVLALTNPVTSISLPPLPLANIHPPPASNLLLYRLLATLRAWLFNSTGC
jgi:hypothetical protein